MKYSIAWVTLRELIRQKIEAESNRVKNDKTLMTACDVSAKCAAYNNVLSLMNDLGTCLTVSE